MLRRLVTSMRDRARENTRLADDNGQLIRALSGMTDAAWQLHQATVASYARRGEDTPAWVTEAGREVVEGLAVLRRFGASR